MPKTPKSEIQLEEETENPAETKAGLDLKRILILGAASLIGVWIVFRGKNGQTKKTHLTAINGGKTDGNPEGKIERAGIWESVPLKPL